MTFHRTTPLRISAALAGVVLTLCVMVSEALAVGDWAPTGSLNVPRADHTATLLRDGTVLVAGGRASGTVPEASAETYDPATGTWTAVAPMAFARLNHTATLIDGPACTAAAPPAWCGKVLVAGGTASPAAELYDPDTRMWSTVVQPLANPRTMHTATLLRGTPCTTSSAPAWCGKVLVVGGDSTTGRLASAELYDPGSRTWSPAGSLADARRLHSMVLLRSGKVLVAGGQGTTGTSLGTAELYDPATNAWNSAGVLAVSRYSATGTLLPDGRPQFAGGLDDAGGLRRSTEIYDPAAAGGPWIDGGAMNEGRALHTATVLPDGTTLVVGNEPSRASASSAELYSAHAWLPAADLLIGRGRHTATLLGGPRCATHCGDLLVVGGRRGIMSLPSAELYDAPEPALPPVPPVPPSYPLPSNRVTNLSAKSLSARRIRLTFTAPRASSTKDGPPAKRYLIKQARRSISSSNFSRARSLCGGTCSFSPRAAGDRITLTVSGLFANRAYHYALQPISGAGERNPISNAARATTHRDRIRPGRVRGLAARGLSGRINLRFRAAGSDRGKGPPVRRYEIKESSRPIRGSRIFRRARSICAKTCRFVPRRVGARLSITLKGLCSSRKRYYAIRARDEGGNVGPRARFRATRALQSRPFHGRCRRR